MITAQKSLAAWFEEKRRPRLVLSGILTLTAACGLVFSATLLHLGLINLALRLPVAMLVAYAVFLAMVYLWAAAEARKLSEEKPGLPKEERRESFVKSNRLSSLDYFDPFGMDADSIPVFAILIAALGAVIFVVTLINLAPVLLAETVCDVAIAGTLYGYLGNAQEKHWLATAIRRTYLHAAILAVVLFGVGAVLEEMAPGAHTLPQAVRQIENRKK